MTIINAAWGLGESVVQGAVDPDEFVVFKPFLGNTGLAPILEKSCGGKERKMVYGTGAQPTEYVPTSKAEQNSFAISDTDVLTLSRWACGIEDHYGCPMDIEWAKDGLNGELFVVQARPETVQSRRDMSVLSAYRINSKGKLLAKGLSIGNAVATGRANSVDAAGIRNIACREPARSVGGDQKQNVVER